MKNRSVLNSPRLLELKKRKHKIFRRKIFFWLFLFFLFLVGLSFLSKWEKINITNVIISGNKIIEVKLIEDTIREKIKGSYLWFFPKTNFLLYPKKEIEQELANKFKRLTDISLKVKNLNTLDVSVAERKALYTYCGTMPPEINNIGDGYSNEKCYFMDENGYIFDEAPYFSGDVYLKFYGLVPSPTAEGKTSNDIDPSGTNFFQLIFKKLISFRETLGKIGIKGTSFFVEDNGDIKMFLSSSSSIQPYIIFKTDSDFDKIIENLQSVLATEPLQSDYKKKYPSLSYIDLRFGNKVYYKFK